MSGKCREWLRGNWSCWLRPDLARCFLVSIVIHGTLLFGWFEVAVFPASQLAVGSSGRSARLQVSLVGSEELDSTSRQPAGVRAVQRIGAREMDIRRGANFPPPLSDSPPELMSEIPSEIDDSRVIGFLILALDIDDQGVPSGAEVIYSELPMETTGELVKRFVAAKFKPALKGGQAIAGSVLLRIDVE